jgi:hypothetical protein
VKRLLICILFISMFSGCLPGLFKQPVIHISQYPIIDMSSIPEPKLQPMPESLWNKLTDEDAKYLRTRDLELKYYILSLKARIAKYNDFAEKQNEKLSDVE